MKYNMKTKILSTIVLGFSLIFMGCNDYLDLSPTDRASNKLMWTTPEYGQLALNNCYHYINIYGVFGDGQSGIGLTEGATETLKYGSLTRMIHMGFANELAFGTNTDTPTTVETFLGGWGNLYSRIMKVNETYSDFKQFAAFDDDNKKLLEGQIRFFRGMLYFELIKRYKNVILYDENLDEVVPNKALSSEEDGWTMVENDLRFAAENLPVEWESKYYGRVTKGAAYAMLSRAMLYAKRWDVAKQAAKEVIDLKKADGSEVYDLNTEFKNAFKTGYNNGNKESILEFRYQGTGPSHSFDDHFTPKGDPGVVQGGMGVPTQEMVESFEKADGSGFPDWSPWHVDGGTTLTPPYADLEPRFHATVLYNGVTWKDRTVQPFVGGTDGWCSYKDDPNPQGRTTTGYYLRKLVDESHNLSSMLASTQPFISIRYAEVLLNYAEACYQSNDPGQANWAVREIRDRVGLTYTDKSGEALMAAIRQERKVELAYEGHLYWDMRRWELSHTQYTGTRVHGFKIEKEGAGFRYTYVDCDKQDRYFSSKLYRLPLPLAEIQNNTAVEQFPEWR